MMNKLKILLASAIVFYLLKYEQYALVFVSEFLFDIQIRALVEFQSTFSILWRVCVSVALIFLIGFPLVVCFVSAILRISTKNLRYVFLVLTISYTAFSLISPFVFVKPEATFNYFIVRAVCALSMVFVTYSSFSLEGDKGAEE